MFLSTAVPIQGALPSNELLAALDVAEELLFSTQTTTSAEANPTSAQESVLGPGAVAGIVIAIIVFLALIVLVFLMLIIIMCYSRKRHKTLKRYEATKIRL